VVGKEVTVVVVEVFLLLPILFSGKMMIASSKKLLASVHSTM